MRTLPWIGAALAVASALTVGGDAQAEPRAPTAQALKETARRLIQATRRDRLEKPMVLRAERTVIYSLGKVPLPTELTGSHASAVLLQAQMEVEWVRIYAEGDAFVELWWRGALDEADAAIAGTLRTLARTRISPGHARALAEQMRQHVRTEILVRPFQRLLGRLDREHPGPQPHGLQEKSAVPHLFVVPVRLVVTPANATVRYCSEWDWELWTLLGEDPRTKMSSLSTAEPVRLDGSYYFELTAPGAPAPILVGPRGVDPSTGTVTLP